MTVVPPGWNEGQWVRLLAALDVAEGSIRALFALVPEGEGGWPDERAHAAAQGFMWVAGDGPFLGMGGTMTVPHGWKDCPPVCTEPREGDPDKYAGGLCGEPAEFLVWGGRGSRNGVPVVYPACVEHARKWGGGEPIRLPPPPRQWDSADSARGEE